jgi:hypothetical protein
LVKSEINSSIFLLFFSSKIFFKKCNEIRFLRNDDRREVKCVWNGLLALINNIKVITLIYVKIDIAKTAQVGFFLGGWFSWSFMGFCRNNTFLLSS